MASEKKLSKPDISKRFVLQQAVQRAAGDVGNAQKSIQTNGAYVASPIPQASPSPPTVNINVPGLGGNGGTQGPPGISYAAPAAQVCIPHSTLDANTLYATYFCEIKL